MQTKKEEGGDLVRCGQCKLDKHKDFMADDICLICFDRQIDAVIEELGLTEEELGKAEESLNE